MWRWMREHPWIWLVLLVAVLLALDVALVLIAAG
jgi:hypothetical protein